MTKILRLASSALLVISLSSCGGNKQLVVAADHPISKILVLLANHGATPDISMDPYSGQAAGLLGGLAGAAIYAAVVHKSASGMAPLKQKLDNCGFLSQFIGQIERDLGAHPDWRVAASTSVDMTDDLAFRTVFVGSTESAESVRRMQDAATKQGISHVLVVNLNFYGVFYASGNTAFYDVTAQGRLFDVTHPEKNIWANTAVSRTREGAPNLSLSAQIQAEASEVCRNLLGEAASVSLRFADELWGPGVVLTRDENGDIKQSAAVH